MSISGCVILHMSVITQRGDSALMMAASEGETKVVVELVKAGANVEMQNRVCQKTYIYTCTCVCKLCVYNYNLPYQYIVDVSCVCHHTGWRLCTDGGCQGG